MFVFANQEINHLLFNEWFYYGVVNIVTHPWHTKKVVKPQLKFTN